MEESLQQDPTKAKFESANGEVDGEGQDEVGLLQRKTRSFRHGNATADGDSTNSTIISSSSSSSASDTSSGRNSVSTDESNRKELNAEEDGHGVAFRSAEAPALQQELNGFHGEQHDETNGSVYFDKDQGAESNGLSATEPGSIESHVVENPYEEMNKPDVQSDLTEKVNHQITEIEEIAREDPHEHKVGLQLKSKVQVSEDADVIEEVLDKELLEEYDVEKVLESQESHDLYCPNCNSCITGRVVLKRRKRKIRHVLNESKREKLEMVGPSQTDANPIQETNDDGAENVFSNDSTQAGAGDRDSERGPSIFRCLSCLSIFIPTGNGFKLFRVSKDNKEVETPLLSQQTTAVKKNWFLSIFGTNDEETTVELSETAASGSQVNQLDNVPPSNANDQSIAQVSDRTVIKSKESAQSANRESSSAQKSPTKIIQKSDTSNAMRAVQNGVTTSIQGNKRVHTTPIDASKPPINMEVAVEDAASEFHNTGLKILVSSATVSSTVEKAFNVANGNEQPVQNVKLPPIQPSLDIKIVNKVTMGPHRDRIDNEFPLEGASSPLEEQKVSAGMKLEAAVNDNILADKVTVIIDPVIPEPKPSQILQSNVPTEPDSLLQGRTQTQANETRDIEAREGHKVEILKSILYGGLMESITSLGVISSAAGSGASTLNILVLGLANLTCGLILIVHNLQELKDENSRRTSTNNNQFNEQEDRYRELLGRRENFRLHAFAAILSFIIFGLIPPVVYGFSFRKSDNKDYKAASVLATSLISIILLAIGKAHVKKPPNSYVKTVLYYTSIGIAASGISYIVGDLLRELIEKYGWSDSSTSPAGLRLPLLEGKASGFGYSSY